MSGGHGGLDGVCKKTVSRRIWQGPRGARQDVLGVIRGWNAGGGAGCLVLGLI